MRGYVTQSLKYYSHLDVWTRDLKHTPFRDAALRMVPLCYAGTLGPQSAAALGEYIVIDMFADASTGRKTPKDAARQWRRVSLGTADGRGTAGVRARGLDLFVLRGALRRWLDRCHGGMNKGHGRAKYLIQTCAL